MAQKFYYKTDSSRISKEKGICSCNGKKFPYDFYKIHKNYDLEDEFNNIIGKYILSQEIYHYKDGNWFTNYVYTIHFNNNNVYKAQGSDNFKRNNCLQILGENVESNISFQNIKTKELFNVEILYHKDFTREIIFPSILV
jgi:hypothetical protein